MAAYRVIGPRAIALVAGKRVVLDQGSVIPDGADAGRVKHLLDVGLIAKISDQQEASDEPKPVDRMTADELKAYAAVMSIDITAAANKAETLAVIQAAEANGSK